MGIVSASTDRIGKGLQQRACSPRHWGSIGLGGVVSLLVVANMASAQPIELVSPNEEADGHFGCSASGVPDVDGDGRGDVVVGAYNEDPGASPNDAGRAYIFSGSGGTLVSILVSPNEETSGIFGSVVSGIPDVDGDGRGDVIVGAQDEAPGASPNWAGRAYIFSGTGGTLLSTLRSPNEEWAGCFGYCVSGIPDVDGDGRGDVVVGALYEDPIPSATDAGRAYIFSGSDGTLLSTLVSPNEESYGRFGGSVSGVPDVDGDGRGDVIVGAYWEDPGASPLDAGRAYIFSGSDGALLCTLMSPNEEAHGCFGASVSGVPDVSGDGRGDVIAGAVCEAPGASPDEAGRAYIFSGSDCTLLSTLVSPNEEYQGSFGGSVSGVPDMDGDGRGDVIVGAYWESPGASPDYAGRAYVFSGSDGTLLSILMSPNEEMNGTFGCSVPGIPDVDGDGRGDVAVGALGEDPGASPTNAGRAHIFRTGPEINVAIPGGSLDFVQTASGPTAPQTVSIENSGTMTLSFTGDGVVINGTNAGDFIISASDISPIPAGTTRAVEIVFDPAVLDGWPRVANLAISTDDFDEPTVTVPLTGLAYLSVEDWIRY